MNWMRIGNFYSGLLCLVASQVGAQEISPPGKSARPPAESSREQEVPLLDGKSLTCWNVSVFGGDGSVAVQEGVLKLGMGDPLTGIAYAGTDLPRMDYELQLEGRRTSGNDFFCCLTFPVEESFCSLVVGGWAGTIVGISCIDEQDAARNETARTMSFSNGQWYRIRVQVRPKTIRCWIDDELVVDVATEGKKLSLRNEVLLSRPLGICNFQTEAEIRNFRLVRLNPESK